MAHRFRTVLLALTLCFGWSAHARGQEEVGCEGPLQDESLRHPHTRVPLRTLADLAAVPASAVAWDDADWSRFSAFALPTIGLMLPARPSLDTRIQRWVRAHESEAADRALFKIETRPISFALAGYGAALFATAWATDNDRLFEFGTLSLETLGLVQFWHITSKLLLGRTGPYQDDRGRFYGPTQIHFPGGTPSGHAATTYAMLAVLAEYWDKWPLYVLAHVGGIYASVSLVYNRQHYLSDVIWGAGMGYYMARWVVRHRSSRYRCGKRVKTSFRERMTIMPVVAGTHGIGLTFSLRL